MHRAQAVMESAKVEEDPSPSVADPPRELDDDDDRHAGGSLAGEPLVVSGTDRYLVPLRLACESKQPRVMEVALACIQKLIAYGYVRGKVVQVGKVKRSMIARCAGAATVSASRSASSK